MFRIKVFLGFIFLVDITFCSLIVSVQIKKKERIKFYTGLHFSHHIYFFLTICQEHELKSKIEGVNA